MDTPVERACIAAIDVGTNSIHMIVARVVPGGFEVLAREKSVVRLGSGGGEMTRLSADAMDRGVAALTRMRAVADAHGATVRAVATSAVREADNAEAFLDRCRVEAGVDVRVISGMEEARLIHLGVRQAVPAGDDTVLLVDVGGGSTEIVVSRAGHVLFAQSLKIGAVRLTDRFFPTGDANPGAVAACTDHATSTVAAVAHEVRRLSPVRAVLSSGTAETIARLACHVRGEAPPLTLNMHAFRVDDVVAVREMLLECGSREERAGLPGIDERRADIIVAGTLLLETILVSLGITDLVMSDYALREGVLMDAALAAGLVEASPNLDAGRDSVLLLARRCSVDLDHAERVEGLAVSILEGLRPVVDARAGTARLLGAAAHLCNVGLAVSHSRHHLHAYYIVRNADLMGFDDTEIEMIALACRYHRKSLPKQTHPEYARLADEDQRTVSLMAGVLRVAAALDRSHDGAVRTVRVRPGADGVDLEVEGDPARPSSVDLDIYTARERLELLTAVIGRPVSLVTVGDQSR